MNENKRIYNSRIKIVECVGAKRLNMKKCIGTLQKQTIGMIFNIQNSHLLTWYLPTEEMFQIHGQNRPVANLPVFVFVLSRKNAITKATEYATFGFSFRILIFFPF